jgi:hypothetical protein
VAKLSQAGNLPYSPLLAVVFVALVIGWNVVAKAAAERVVLPVLVPGADPAAGSLRVTNNDGTLSNGGHLRGWRNAAYFGAHVGLWMACCTVSLVGLVRLWPARQAEPRAAPDRGLDTDS